MTAKSKNQKIDESAVKIAELEELVKRTVADYHNLENRMIEEKKSMSAYFVTELLKRLLPAFDTLFLAAKYTKDQGIELTVKQLLDALKNEGVIRIETEEAVFNPAFMECVEVVAGESGKVIEEISPGFTYADKLLRAAKVKVGAEEILTETKN